MYLSRLQLNPTSRTLWRDVIDQPYRLHQLVMHGFPDDMNRQAANVLHRLDQTHNGITLLVQSAVKPAWESLNSNLLLPTDPFELLPNPAVRQLDGLGLENGRFLHFRLRANPTWRKSNGKGNKSGSRQPIFQEEQQRTWLKDKAKLHGFRLVDARINPEGKQVDYRKKLTIYTVLINGRLQITDTTAFHTALRQGIGPAKAFGCGLLSLAPA